MTMRRFRFLTSGESHGKCLNAIIEGVPAGIRIKTDLINNDLAKRQSGYGRGDRMKIETDSVEIKSGVRFGKTTGAPICLEITNKGTHTIIIHKGETMAQLMLVPIQGPILERYSDRGTFINENGYDDGTPYTFWRERSIKSLRKEAGTEQIIDLYNKVLKTMTADNTKDINEAKERFSNNFLPFCQKRIFDSKYHDKDTSNPDAKKLLNAYRKKERFLHDLVYVKYGSIASFIISIINSFVLEYTTNLFGKGNETKNIKDILNENKSWTILSAVSLFIIIILSFQRQKTFCTLENIDIDAL